MGLCGGQADANGCPMPNWCLHVDPYAPCSIHANCPMICPEDQKLCPGSISSDGCPGPETCWAKDEPCPFHCDWNQMMCPGMHPGKERVCRNLTIAQCNVRCNVGKTRCYAHRHLMVKDVQCLMTASHPKPPKPNVPLIVPRGVDKMI